MRRTIVMVLLILLLNTSAFGVSGSEVMYAGGSATAIKPGDMGVFDTKPGGDLVFVGNGKRLSIAYERIKKIEYRQEVAHHLGVAPAIAVGLVKKRARRHFISLAYADEAGEQQAAVFEISKSVRHSHCSRFSRRERPKPA